MKFLLLVVLAAEHPMAISQSPGPDIHRVAANAARLHDTMLDPASFVLDAVYLTKPSKRGNVSVCYEYRSHNTMGGYSAGRAVEDGDDHNRLSTYTAAESGRYPGYNVGWVAPCKSKNLDREITADVAPLAVALYRKER
ncbi:hypothetical protein SAMN05421771_1365 [Granulicella pectinivorans]|uniref:Uncharacterized protein n=1 Tax=Granulicella pectinivorans TaxID=474950 RepID=A0A1I6LW25_9BACT|nr:hypothetical protein [Granulicella pectinivorans]SFS07626.1 hypothetical protein SAMN05421771_1365 [Granulicella pectinivorans]